MINRSVLIVRPKQPFLDWARGLDDSGLLPDVEGEQTVYLVPEFDDEESTQAIIETIYAVVFENELWEWHADSSTWPAHRDLATFLKWFSLEWHSVVEDLCAYALVDYNDE